ncbi:hypothetical protein BRC76_07660 [Halobacteriales archaeon QH_8_67_36]|nr:MAG: hypothetical protein BRC76_07660 [Halobacteriales archaeon QH_8_67_36]
MALFFFADVDARPGMSMLAGTDTRVPVDIVTGLVGGPHFRYSMYRQDKLGTSDDEASVTTSVLSHDIGQVTASPTLFDRGRANDIVTDSRRIRPQ